MSEAPILTALHGDGERRVGVITLNRPKQLNALNDALMDQYEPGMTTAKVRAVFGALARDPQPAARGQPRD